MLKQSLIMPDEVEGQPYIFVSYSRRDTDDVQKVLRILKKNHYRFWYDRGLKTGTEWVEELGNKIKHCSQFLVIISPDAVNSKYVRKEISMAVNLKEAGQIFVLYITHTELTSGLHLLLDDIQAISRTDFATDQEFEQAVCEAAEKETYIKSEQEEIAAEKHIVCNTEELKQPEPEMTQTGKQQQIPSGYGKIKKIFQNKRKIVLLCIVLGILMGGVIFSGVVNKNKNEKKKNLDVYHVTLEAPANMSVQEYKDAMTIVKERLEQYAGEGNYTLEKDGEHLELSINKDTVDDDLNVVLRRYISNAMKLYFGDREAIYDLKSFLSLEREDISDIVVRKGTIEGIVPSDYGVDTEEYWYLEFRLSQRFIEKNKSYLSEKQNHMILATDVGSKIFDYAQVHFLNDFQTVQIFGGNMTERHANMMKYLWEHKTLAQNFYYVLDMNQIVDWEKVEESSKTTMQCNYDEFEEKTVTIKYSISNEENDVALQTAIGVVKKRLECLEQPYAVGTYSEEGKKKFVVRTGVKHMGALIMTLVANQNGLNIQGSKAKIMINGHQENYILEEENENYKFRIAMSESSNKINSLKNLTGFVMNTDDKKLYLTDEDVPILSMELTGEIADGNILFTNLVYPNNQKITKDDMWLMNLIQEVLSGNKLETRFYLEDYSFDQDGQKSDFGINNNAEVKQIADEIRKVYKQAQVYQLKQSEISVALDLDVNEKLPQTSIDTVKDIMENCSFEKSGCSKITFCLIEEDSATSERARIIFSKNIKSVFFDNIEDGKTGISGIFTNGRLNVYKENFKELTQNNEFIKKYTDSSQMYSAWIFD